MDAHTVIIQIINTSTENVYLLKNNKLNIVQDYEKKNCYSTSSENVFLIINLKPAEKKLVPKTRENRNGDYSSLPGRC